MKRMMLNLAAASSLGFMCASASAQTFGDVARVISASPVYERVSSPRQECRAEQVTAYEVRRRVQTAPAEYRAPSDSGIGAGTVIGAIIGGVIGHQFGESSGGRDRGTAAGAVVGGLVGHQVERNAQPGFAPPTSEEVVERVPVTHEVQRCHSVSDAQDKIVGYDVRYDYHGHEFRTRLAYDPGTEMPVNVEVRPPSAVRPPAGVRPGPTTPSYRGM